jgi:antitoxin PrlF
MNAPSKIEHETIVNMTSKGQVLIPKAVRERNGLVPNGPVRVGVNDRGETVILPAGNRADETAEQRYARIKLAIASVRGSLKTGQGTDAIMRELRGDWVP